MSTTALGFTIAGCGSASAGKKPSTASSCSDSAFTRAVSPHLAALDAAVLFVDSGHGDVAVLTKGAPRLRSAATLLLKAAQGNPPCDPKLVKARGPCWLQRETSRAQGVNSGYSQPRSTKARTTPASKASSWEATTAQPRSSERSRVASPGWRARTCALKRRQRHFQGGRLRDLPNTRGRWCNRNRGHEPR